MNIYSKLEFRNQNHICKKISLQLYLIKGILKFRISCHVVLNVLVIIMLSPVLVAVNTFKYKDSL